MNTKPVWDFDKPHKTQLQNGKWKHAKSIEMDLVSSFKKLTILREFEGCKGGWSMNMHMSLDWGGPHQYAL